MNGAEAYQALRGRGYTRDQAHLAISRAPLSDDSTYRLSRHQVSWNQDGWAITPVPWSDNPGAQVMDGLRPPASSRFASLDEILETVRRVDDWLDAAVAGMYRDQPLGQDWARVAKVCEETGEAQEELDAMALAAAQARVAALNVPAGRAISALIAVTGQNPRKGVHGTREALLKELADVAATGLFAIQHFTKDTDATWLVFLEALDKARSRVPAGSVFPPESGMTDQDARDNGITG